MTSDFNTKTRDATRQFDRSHGSFELALSPVILGLLGLWLDRRLGTTPLFVISLAVFGFVGAGVKVFYTYRYQMSLHAQDLGAPRSPAAASPGKTEVVGS